MLSVVFWGRAENSVNEKAGPIQAGPAWGLMEITSEIFQIGGAGYTSPEDAAVYVINFDGHAAMVDAGCGRAQHKLLRNIRSCGVKPDSIELLLITHCHFDHTGGVSGLKEFLSMDVVAHELEASFLEKGDNTVTAAKWYGAAIQPFRIDRRLKGPREEIDLGGRRIEAIHTPGHSPGSVVYLTESDGYKVLFGQDVHGPINPVILSDRDDYLRSLERLLSLDADILCEGHFGVYKGKARVREFIQSFLSAS